MFMRMLHVHVHVTCTCCCCMMVCMHITMYTRRVPIAWQDTLSTS